MTKEKAKRDQKILLGDYPNTYTFTKSLIERALVFEDLEQFIPFNFIISRLVCSTTAFKTLELKVFDEKVKYNCTSQLVFVKSVVKEIDSLAY